MPPSPDLLVIPRPRWVGCAVFLALPVAAAGSAAVNWLLLTDGLDRVLWSAGALASVLLLLAIVGYRTQVVIDASLRAAQVRTTVFGVSVGRVSHLLDGVTQVEVLTRVTQGETKSGRSYTTHWHKVRVGPLDVSGDLADQPEVARALAQRVADHLGLEVVEKPDPGRRPQATPPRPD